MWFPSDITRRITLAGLVFVLGGLARPAAADNAQPLGPRVRVTAGASPRLVGTLVGEDADSLSIDVGKRVVTLPRSAVTKLEFSRGRSKKEHASTVGFLAGAGAGAALGIAGGGYPDKTTDVLVIGGLFGLLGSVVGVLAAPGERWESEPEDHVRIGIGTSPEGGVSARVAIRFGGRR